MMQRTHDAIWAKFRIKWRDNLPYTGWAGTRIQLAELFGELGFNKGAEIGVRDGIYSEILCQANPNLDLLCVDPWHGFRMHSQATMDAIYQQAVQRLSPYKTTLIRTTSLEAVKEIADQSLDFVYIDALHEFVPCMLDIIHWAPKVRPGGIVSGHDFCHFYQVGVVHAVEAFVRAHNIRPWYLTHRDRIPSWLWVN